MVCSLVLIWQWASITSLPWCLIFMCRPNISIQVQQEEGKVTEASNPRRKTLCILPYVKGTSDKIADICRKAGVQPVFQQKTTLRGLLTRVKGPQKHMDKGVVYQIPCAQCNEVYNRKTGRPLETRISAQKSSGHRWCMECQRYPLDEDKSQHGLGGSTRGGQVIWKERKIKESVYIRTRRTYNMDWGSFLWFQKVEHEQKERICRNVPWEGYIWQCYLVKRELYLVDRSCPNHEGQDQ